MTADRANDALLLFFIGAGFTKAIANSAPTGNDFLVKAFEPSWTFAKQHKIMELKDFVEFAYHPITRHTEFPRIEDVLSLLDFCLASPASFADRYDSESLVRLKGTIIFIISQMIRESIEDRSRGSQLDLSRRFVEQVRHSGRRACMISTNYDIILDNALLSVASSCNYGVTLRKNVALEGMQNRRPTDCELSWDFEGGYTTSHGTINEGNIPLLKIHGSLNWLYCPRCDEIDITIGRKGISSLLQDVRPRLCVNRYCTCRYDPLLVTPTMLKVYSIRALKEVWTLCEQSVAKASKLVFIGYSLPEADYLIRTMITRGLVKHPRRTDMEIIVIDKRRESRTDKKIGKELDSRYASLFGKIRVEPIGLEGLMNDFNGTLKLVV